LFAWLPVVGDSLTIMAGALRVNLPLFVVLVAATLGWNWDWTWD
jgi:membrane protein YqaA with SNARE-associated domain